MEDQLRYCYNKGCGQKFKESDNNPEACVFHPGPVYFHDAYKIWNCCNKKSTDFSTWLSFKGCTRGRHNPDKPVEDNAKPVKKEHEIRPEPPEEVIVWNGLNQPAARDDSQREMSSIRVEPTEAALKAIEAKARMDNGDASIHIGVACTHAGCDKVYSGESSDQCDCVYHPGVAVFHEGMKYWSCCEKKTSDFGNFLEQKGCTTDKHCWSKNERVDKMREDWFSRSGYIHLNVYCKGAIPGECLIQSNGLILTAKVVHGFGTKQTDLNYELFGEIDVPQCRVIVGERKLEMVLKQKGVESWPRLTYNKPLDPSEQ